MQSRSRLRHRSRFKGGGCYLGLGFRGNWFDSLYYWLAHFHSPEKPWGSVAPKMTSARAFISSSWVVPQLSSGSKRNNLGLGQLGFMRRASPCPYPRATLARSIITWWRSPAGRFNCSPQSLRLDIIMGALSNGYKLLSEFFTYYHFPLLRILCDFCNLTDLVRDVGSFF